MGDGCERDLFFEQLLGLFVELGTLLFVRGVFGGSDQFVELGVAPLGEVVAIDRVAAEQGAEPVVGVTVVAAFTGYLFINADAVEGHQAQGADLETFDVFAHRLIHR